MGTDSKHQIVMAIRTLLLVVPVVFATARDTGIIVMMNTCISIPIIEIMTIPVTVCYSARSPSSYCHHTFIHTCIYIYLCVYIYIFMYVSPIAFAYCPLPIAIIIFVMW